MKCQQTTGVYQSQLSAFCVCVCVHTILLEYSHSYFFTIYLQLLLSDNGKAEWLWQRLSGPWSLKYDMTLYRELANPCCKYSLYSHHLPVPEAVLITTLHGKKALRVRASSLEGLHEAHTQTLRFQDGPKIILVRTEVPQACVRNTGLNLSEW